AHQSATVSPLSSPLAVLPYTTLFRSELDRTQPRRRRDVHAAVGVGAHRLRWVGNVSKDELSGSRLASLLRRIAPEGDVRLSPARSEEHTSELQSLRHIVCRLRLEKKK